MGGDFLTAIPQVIGFGQDSPAPNMICRSYFQVFKVSKVFIQYVIEVKVFSMYNY